MPNYIGIDLGTTNSVMATVVNGRPVIIPNAEGERVTPSVIFFNQDDRKFIVGSAAKRNSVLNHQDTFFSLKRLLGFKVTDECIRKDLMNIPYTVKADRYDNPILEVHKRQYSPVELLSKIIEKLRNDAEIYTDTSISDVVVTVPAYFNMTQRRATVEACQEAKVHLLRLISEPVSAALAYGLGKEEDTTILVYHLGGGTFDASILEIGDGVFEVKATCGDTHLGGDDFDHRIVDWLCERFKSSEGIDLKKDKAALARLKEAAEKAKCELSSSSVAKVNLPFISKSGNTYRDLMVEITRSELEQLVEPYVRKTLELCYQGVLDAGKLIRKYGGEDDKQGARSTNRFWKTIRCKSDIDEIILVGEQTRMPFIRDALKDYFGIEPRSGRNPAEVVAEGAAIQAGVLKGEIMETLLLDVVPQSLGVETKGGIGTKLIERNTTIPTIGKEIFSTTEDGQDNVKIPIFQGERAMAQDNYQLGELCLKDIRPAPKGIPKIEVKFEIDANGTIHVSATDKDTGNEQRVFLNIYE